MADACRAHDDADKLQDKADELVDRARAANAAAIASQAEADRGRAEADRGRAKAAALQAKYRQAAAEVERMEVSEDAKTKNFLLSQTQNDLKDSIQKLEDSIDSRVACSVGGSYADACSVTTRATSGVPGSWYLSAFDLASSSCS